MRSVVHWDGDRFFASIEQASDRRLRHRPVAIGAPRRGVVVSASPEAYRFGIRPGMAVRRARQACPALTIIPGHFDLYEQFFEQMIQLCEQTTPLVEPATIGSAYLDLTGTGQIHQLEAGPMVARLRHTVFSWLRVSFSAGIAANKTVARIAARLRKPAGQSVVPPGSEQSFLAPLPVQLLEGLGRQSREVLELAGVRSLGALAAAPLDALQLALGKQARHWQLQAQGVDESPVRPRRTLPHAFRETIEFPEEAFEHTPVLAQLRVALERILAATRAQNVEPRRLTLTLRYTDREESTHSTSLAQPSNLEWDWDPTLPALLRNGWRRRVRLRAMTLAASLIYSPSPQLSLFSEPRRESGALLRLATSMDEIRRKYGQGVIHRGWKGLH